MAAKKTTSQVSTDADSSLQLGSNRSVAADKELREFMWHMVAISGHLEEIRRIWAELLGVSGPQWLILMAIGDSSSEQGLSVGEVAEKIRVNSTFVTAQTKSLEMAGLVRRATSAADARIVLLSLTEKARNEIAKLATRRRALEDSIFAGIGERALTETKKTLATIDRRAEKAVQQLRIDRS
jgi:MarR family transcriptional regulator, organic hydroperoxide resistance regulator